MALSGGGWIMHTQTVTASDRDARMERSYWAFWRDWPELLEQYRDQWVAYHDEKFLGHADEMNDLMAICHRAGFDIGDCFALIVEPGLDRVYGPNKMGPDEPARPDLPSNHLDGAYAIEANGRDEPLPRPESIMPVSPEGRTMQTQAATVSDREALKERGYWAFWRDWPELLEKYRDQWVAYRGDQFLGHAGEFDDLLDLYDRRQLDARECFAVVVEPGLDQVYGPAVQADADPNGLASPAP